MNKLIKNPNKSIKKLSKQKNNILEGKQNKHTKAKPQPSKLLVKLLKTKEKGK